MSERYPGRVIVQTETYSFSGRFQFGSLAVSPVHVRVEQLRPIIAAHRHSNVSYEIHYTHRGSGTVTVGDVNYGVHAGVLYVTGPGVVHMQVSDPGDPVIEYCLYLNCRRAAGGGDDPMDLFAGTGFWIGQDDGTMLRLLSQLIEENRAPRCDCAEMSETLLRRIILQLTRLYRSGGAVQAQKPSQATQDSLMPVLEDAFFYRYRTLTLGELSATLNLSARQTQRLLKTRFGKTFSQKLTEARMAAACQFLRNTRLSVTEIADRLGFSSIEHFSAAFSRAMGCAPSAYRKGNGAKRKV